MTVASSPIEQTNTAAVELCTSTRAAPAATRVHGRPTGGAGTVDGSAGWLKRVSRFGATMWLAWVFAVVGSIFLTNLLYFTAIDRVGLSRATLFGNLQPFFAVVGSLLGIVLAPILPCALTLAYYDLRVRREAFDIQILSEQLGPR